MTKICLLDDIGAAGLEILKTEQGFEVHEIAGEAKEEIRKALTSADVLIAGSKTGITADLLEQAPVLRIVGRSGPEIDNIDMAAATRRGIIVMNTPLGNSISSAEYTMGLMLSLMRKIPQANAAFKGGSEERNPFIGAELFDKTLGVIGCGRVGTEVVRRASGFRMHVLVCDPFVSETRAQELNVRLVKFEELLSQSDIVTLHLPLNSSTRKLIDFRALVLMKDGAYLLNTTRAELVDEEALLSALKSGKLSGAALDCAAPGGGSNRNLVALPNVLATPGISALTAESKEKIGLDIATQVRDYFRYGIVSNAVNFPSISLEEHLNIAPYLQLGARLGSFASQVSTGRMNEVTVGYGGEMSAMHAQLVRSSILAGMLRPILTEGVTLVNALTTAKDRGIRIVESRSSEEKTYSSLISVKLKTDLGETWVEGAVLHHKRMHLVSLSGIDIEAPLAGIMLIVRNMDTPGVIGRVGTILGSNGINIANFALGRNEDTHDAVGVVNVDSEIPAAVVEELRALTQVKEVHVVRV